MSNTEEKTREELFSEGYFQWVKTERSGDVCRFLRFEVENDTEYTVFQDNTRIRTDLIGDVVLMHQHPVEILPEESFSVTAPPPLPPIQDPIILKPETKETLKNVNVFANQDPVVAILEKTKKKTEKITLTISVKIPSPELYNVVRENFENTDEILLENVMQQIKEEYLRESLKKELQNIYATKKRKPQ